MDNRVWVANIVIWFQSLSAHDTRYSACHTLNRNHPRRPYGMPRRMSGNRHLDVCGWLDCLSSRCVDGTSINDNCYEMKPQCMESLGNKPRRCWTDRDRDVVIGGLKGIFAK